MSNLKSFLEGGDLRSTANVEQLLPLIKNQQDFDELFEFMLSKERLIVMRAADAVEKVTLDHPHFLIKHKSEVLQLLSSSAHIELKWHLALLVPRMPLSKEEFQVVWATLKAWAKDSSESKIVRVNALQTLWELAHGVSGLQEELEDMFQTIQLENVPSLAARIRKLKKRK